MVLSRGQPVFNLTRESWETVKNMSPIYHNRVKRELRYTYHWFRNASKALTFPHCPEYFLRPSNLEEKLLAIGCCQQVTRTVNAKRM